MAIIGRGSFTTCKDNFDGSVTLVTVDPIKSAYTEEMPPMFPVMDYVDYDGEKSIYTMEKLTIGSKVSGGLSKNLDKAEYKKYQALRKAWSNYIVPRNRYDSYSSLYDLFSNLENEELRDNMLDALDNITNYTGTVGFEISPRNVAIKDGKLILLDCFYCFETLDKVRRR